MNDNDPEWNTFFNLDQLSLVMNSYLRFGTVM